jgi:hypothetical protein
MGALPPMPTRDPPVMKSREQPAARDAEAEAVLQLSPFRDHERDLQGARRPMRMARGWRVYQMSVGRTRA